MQFLYEHFYQSRTKRYNYTFTHQFIVKVINLISRLFLKTLYILNTYFLEDKLRCFVCNETEAGCIEEPEDAKIVECQLDNQDSPNYGNACMVGHTGMPHNYNLKYSIIIII